MNNDPARRSDGRRKMLKVRLAFKIDADIALRLSKLTRRRRALGCATYRMNMHVVQEGIKIMLNRLEAEMDD